MGAQGTAGAIEQEEETGDIRRKISNLTRQLGRKPNNSEITQFLSSGTLPPDAGPAPDRDPILTQLDNNPATKDLPEEVKEQILADPLHPLNPTNPNGLIGQSDEFAAIGEGGKTLEDEQAQKNQARIENFATEFEAATQGFGEKFRTNIEGGLGRLQSGLAGSRQATFEQANPFILEDLNRRGLLSSGTATADAQARALAGLQAGDEGTIAQARLAAEQGLQRFQTGSFEQGQGLRSDALEALIGGEQAGLDRFFDASTARINKRFEDSQAAEDRNFQRSLARGSRGSGLAGAGIGAVGSVLGSFVGKKR